MLALGACSADRLNIPNYGSPTVGAIENDPAAAIPLLATGVLRDDRGNHTAYVLGLGILGREAYNYTPTEGRNTTGFLVDPLNAASFGGVSNWSGPYFTLRDAFNTRRVMEGAPSTIFSDAQKNTVRGFTHTMEALALLYLVNTRHDLGLPVELDNDPTVIAPFVSRDSVFNRIKGRLDLAQTELGLAGTTAFPFTFHAGYAGFTTPATYTQFNRALAARVNAYRASLGVTGCGVARSRACYDTVLVNLGQSFINGAATTVAQLQAGPFNVYSAAANDAQNGLSNPASSNIVAHAKADSGIQLRADGVTRDARYTTKVITLSSPKQPPSSIPAVPTNFDYSIYAARTDPVRIITNEELILLRAEARYYTLDEPGARADINTVRTVSGQLPALLTPFLTEAAFLDELLYNRRMSLLFQGHRWVDMRRFGRLNQLTKDLSSHVIVDHLAIPQGECLQRATVDAALKVPANSGCP
jgi:starch-binding outer membrane protein, SusD/RagB family